MKKIAVFALAVPVLGAIMAGSLVAAINMRGGVPASRAWIGDLPVVGRFVKVREKDSSGSEKKGKKDEKNEEKKEGSRRAGDAPLLKLAPPERLARLCEELEKEKADLQSERRKLKEKRRELEAWEKELARKRKNVLKDLKKKKEKLQKLRTKVDKAKEELEKRRVEIKKNKKSNLDKTASIFGRMDARRGAELLTKMYESGKEETVVQILYLMRDRNAAELLGAFTDDKISAQITSRLSYVQKEQKGD